MKFPGTSTSQPQAPKRMRSAFAVVLFAVFLVTGCRPAAGPTVFAVYAPASPLYARLEIQLDRSSTAGSTGDGEIALAFTANDGSVFSFTLTAEGGSLFHAQAHPSLGIESGDLVEPAGLRQLLVDTGMVSAGQFKIPDAERTLALILQLTDPAMTAAVVPSGFRLIETNLDVIE